MCKKKKEKHPKIESFDVDHITDPTFLSDLDNDELDILANEIRTKIINACSIYGGHLSSNLGVVEATIALHKVFDFTHDKLLFDVGHQCYTHKILTGRPLDNLRQKDGTSGFQKRSESSYDHFEAGHSSTAMSGALGMAIARDLNKEDYDVVAFVGDASMMNGESLEALNHAGLLRNKVIFVLNDNEMSITKPVGSISKMFRKMKLSPRYIKAKESYKRLMFRTRFGYFIYRITWNLKHKITRHLISNNMFEEMGFAYIGPVEGHSFKDLEKAFKKAQELKQSSVIHLKTTKGRGYEASENDKTGNWHGVSPFDVKSNLPLKSIDPNLLSWSEIYANLTYDIMEEHLDTVLVTPATLLGSGLQHLFAKFSSRTFDVGIAEMHAFGLATGLALNGKLPIISIYSTFMQRAFDQIIHDLARMNLGSIILVDRAGLVGADGETHQGIFDEAFLLNVPNVTVAMASSPSIAKAIYLESLSTKQPVFLRYPRLYVEISQANNEVITLGRGEWLIEHRDPNEKVALITFGPLVEELKPNLPNNITLVNAIYQKPYDKNVLSSLLNYQRIIIVDAYGTEIGFPLFIEHELRRLGYQGQIIIRGIKTEFIEQATIAEQAKSQEVDEKSILALVKETITDVK